MPGPAHGKRLWIVTVAVGTYPDRDMDLPGVLKDANRLRDVLRLKSALSIADTIYSRKLLP